ncbi:hypothetical protein FB451DRAFT_1376795 [Mycena latifolia]|nr:hypothetical protein FB451DRAFT_1376795 [Mycena latifolia]
MTQSFTDPRSAGAQSLWDIARSSVFMTNKFPNHELMSGRICSIWMLIKRESDNARTPVQLIFHMRDSQEYLARSNVTVLGSHETLRERYVGTCQLGTYGANVGVKKDPATFRSGDVVEMGFAIVAFKQAMRGGDPNKHVCKLVLRTLTVLDSSLSKAAFQARMSSLLITKDIPALKERPKELLVRTLSIC